MGRLDNVDPSPLNAVAVMTPLDIVIALPTCISVIVATPDTNTSDAVTKPTTFAVPRTSRL